MYVHHDYTALSAADVVSALKSEGFAATLQKDGAPSKVRVGEYRQLLCRF